MHTFVIGGTGFLGAALVRRLLEAGHHVTTFSRGRAGLAPAHPRLEAVYGDRHDVAALEAATAGRTFDAVFDLAAYTPEASEAAVRVFRGRTGRFVHCSTVSVYMVSDDVACPITEDQDQEPLMDFWPRNPFGMQYGIDKRRCEDVLWAAHDPLSFPVSMLRPTFVSGPGDPTRRDYFWIERLLDGGPILVPGHGHHRFQQVYVDDVARAFTALLDHSISVGRAYNVAAEEVFSLEGYLHALARLLGRDPVLVHVDQDRFDALPFSTDPHGDVFPFNTRRDAVFSLERIRRDLGYRSTPFDDWMGDTIAWYRTHAAPSTGYAHRPDEIALCQQAA